jgi:hypothetical protein
MAITSFDPRNPRVIPHNGVPQITDRYSEANSQSFKAGQFVVMSSGAVSVGAAGDSPIFGIALADATSVSSGNIVIPVEVINQDDDVLIQVAASGGTVEAANTTCVPGVAYDIQVASNHCTINSSDTTNPKFVFVEAIKDAAGDATYWGRFKPYYLENQPSAG